MSIQSVFVPDIGNYKEVTVIEVAVKVGDTLAAEDNILTLETDKAAMEIPAPFAGVVKELHIKAGDKVGKGALILSLESSDTVAAAPIAAPAPAPVAAEAAAAPVAVAPAAVPAPTPAPVAAEPTAKAHASPAIRRFARELGVDLSKVGGSGTKGRVTKEDVQAFVKAALARPAAPTGGLQVLDMPSIDFAQFGAIEVKPLSRIKKISGANLHRNWVSLPHVTQFDEADITELEAFRKEMGAEYAKQNVKLTPLAFILKAVVAALQKFPEFNASLDGENLVLKRYYHIGVAVDTPDGLMVPVLRNVDQKGVVQLAKELAEISARAREKKITAADMQGGCFSISSLGGIGGTAFTPIINAPEVAILGISKSSLKPVYQNGQFVPRLMLPLSLSYDHRVIDGAAGARFTSYLAQMLGDIRRLML